MIKIWSKGTGDKSGCNISDGSIIEKYINMEFIWWWCFGWKRCNDNDC